MGDPATTSQATAAARNANQPDPLLGRVINDRFKILAMIARGGMGRVYRAEQAPLGRICALKVLHPNYQGENDPEFHKRFFLEASTASKLHHPNTVTVYDYGQTDDGVYFMAMELLEGRTLHRLIREESPIDGLRAVHILLQTCRSLREAHANGVIHRDLKPANIFLIHHDEDPDFVKVLDFGLVKSVDEANPGENLTQTGLFMGSPKYMAPEQIRGEKVSAATDVYSLGVILYEMLTGKVPFDRPNSVNVLMAHVSEPVPPMQTMNPSAYIPPVLEELAYRCLAKRPEDRFVSMDEFIAALKRTSGSLGAPVMGVTVTGEYAGTSARPSALPPSDHPGGILRDPTPSSSRVSVIGLPSDRPGQPAIESPPLPSPAPDLAAVAFATLSESPPTRSRRSLLVGAGALLFAFSFGAGMWFKHRPAEAPLVVPGHTIVPPIVIPPTPPAPAHVTVALDSTPPGAQVLEGSTVLGHTPFRDEWTGDRADPTRTHTFVMRLAGYADATLTLHGGSLTGSAVLQPQPADVRSVQTTHATQPMARPQAPVVRRTRPATHDAAPAGYRTDPYGDDNH